MSVGQWLFEKISAYFSTDTGEERRSYLCDFGRICHELIPGDVVLVEGTNRISDIIKRVVNSRWTHAALYIGRLHNIEDPRLREIVRRHYHGSASNQLLVETIVGQGTLINPLSAYKNHHIRICRPVGLSYTDAQKVLEFALKHVGHTYNTRQFLDLGRFLLASRWFIPKRWKSSLFERSSNNEITQDICSSMLAEAFVSIQFPILPVIRYNKDHQIEMIHRNPKLFTPADFDYSPYFSIIKYPVFSVPGHGPYHDLPWREDLVSHDEGIIEKQVDE